MDVTSSLTMSENFQNPSLLGTANSLQLSLPVVSNTTSTAGSVCDFSRVSAPAVSPACLLPSAPDTSFHPLMGSAYLCQHSSTTMLSWVTGQSQISTSAASYPGSFEWDITGSTGKNSSSLGDFTVTVNNQATEVSSMSMTAQYDETSDANAMVPVYPSLSATIVQGPPSQIPNQGHNLSLPYQEGSQVYYYNASTPGPLLSGELGPCLLSYGSMSYTGNRASAPQPQMVMVLKEVQPTDVLTPVSTSGLYYSLPAQPIAETSFQVMKTSRGMEPSLGLQPPSQTFSRPQISEFPRSCSRKKTQELQNNPTSQFGDISMMAPVQTSTNILALPPAPSQELTEDKNSDAIKTTPSRPLDAYEIPTDNQDPPLFPIDLSDIHQLLACIDPVGQEMPHSQTANLGNNSLSLEDQGTLENGIESCHGFADIATLVEDIHLPQLFNSLTDLDQSKGPPAVKAKDRKAVKGNQVQEEASAIKGPTDQVRKNKNKASEPCDGAPKAKIQRHNPECLLEGEEVVDNAAASDRAAVNTGKHSNSKPPEAPPSRTGTAKGHGQEKAKRARENNSRKAEERKQSGKKVKAAEKPTIPMIKRRRNQPDLSQEAFKKPRSCLGMYMLESVQVFHALGKKSDKNTGLSSSRALGKSSSTKGLQPSSAIQSWRDTPQEGKGPEDTQGKAQKAESSANKERPSPSQDELPPPGQVKLVPLPFPTLDKPQARPVSHRPQCAASRRPTAAYPARPHSNSSRPPAINPSQPAPANTALPGPVKPAQPGLTNATRPGLNNPTQSSVSQSAASRPAPYKTSSGTSLPHKPVPTAVTKPHSPPKSQAQFLLQDFSCQPIPWRKPDVPEPGTSNPITKEQRPEREAMKRQAQQEREKAAKYTSLGKVQFFIQRQKDRQISRYYGYVM